MTYSNLLSLYQDVVERRQELEPLFKEYKSNSISDLNEMTEIVIDWVSGTFLNSYLNKWSGLKKLLSTSDYQRLKLIELSNSLKAGNYSKIPEYVELVREIGDKIKALKRVDRSMLNKYDDAYNEKKRIDDDLKKLDQDWSQISKMYTELDTKKDPPKELIKEMDSLCKSECEFQKKFNLLNKYAANNYIDQLPQLENNLRDFAVAWGPVYRWTNNKPSYSSTAERIQEIINSKDLLYAFENLSKPWLGGFLEKLGNNGFSQKLLERWVGQYNSLIGKRPIINQALEAQCSADCNISQVLTEFEKIKKDKSKTKEQIREIRIRRRELMRDLFGDLHGHWNYLGRVRNYILIQMS